MDAPTPVVYATDLRSDRFDPADLFDLAYLLRSERHHLSAVCLTDANGHGNRVLAELAAAVGSAAPVYVGPASVADALAALNTPANLIVVGGYETVTSALDADRAGFRERVARCFVIGGVANDYTRGRAGERIPIDPRLRDRHPDQFTPSGDDRVRDKHAWGRLVTSGEGVIWLPRGISLWRYGASGMLEDGGPTSEYLLRQVHTMRLADSTTDQGMGTDTTVLLSSLPALLLAVEPDPFAWMRLFRATAARVSVDEAGTVTEIAMPTARPNLYAVVAIDGTALSKLLTSGLRNHPLTP